MTTFVHAFEIRGAISNVGMSEVTWTPQNFAGFYYDFDHNMGDESLTLRLSDATPTGAVLSDQLDANGDRGIVYKANMRQVTAFSNAKIDEAYGLLRVATINSTTGIITLDNKDNQITLSRNKTINLVPGIWIKTADQSTIDASTPLRYCIFTKVTKPGTYELRSSMADSSSTEYTYDNSTFPGFYYDIDKNIGGEQITFRLTDSNGASAVLSDQADPAMGMRGIIYRTVAQSRNFKFRPWGQYMEIGFLGDRYFAGYENVVTQSMTDAGEVVPLLYDRSKNRNLMTNEQLSKVLIDDATTKLVKKGQSLKLKEGYELSIEGVNSEGQIYLTLLKNGQTIDESFISPSVSGATMTDKTYYYKKDIGDTNSIVLIAVHFRSVYRDVEQPMAIVDGIFQIADTPTAITSEQQYGRMSIRSVDPTGIITMDNKDNQINLTRKIDVELMPMIHLRTADNETLRYYIYKTQTIA